MKIPWISCREKQIKFLIKLFAASVSLSNLQAKKFTFLLSKSTYFLKLSLLISFEFVLALIKILILNIQFPEH